MESLKSEWSMTLRRGAQGVGAEEGGLDGSDADVAGDEGELEVGIVELGGDQERGAEVFDAVFEFFADEASGGI